MPKSDFGHGGQLSVINVKFNFYNPTNRKWIVQISDGLGQQSADEFSQLYGSLQIDRNTLQ